jgi:uncharacterized OB-fold protein
MNSLAASLTSSDSLGADAQSLPGYLSRGDLRYRRCTACQLALGYGEQHCPCGMGSVEWVRATGHARLHSFVVYQRAYHPSFPPPHRVAHVELEEGPRLISHLLLQQGPVKIGMQLRATFNDDGMLVFAPLP